MEDRRQEERLAWGAKLRIDDPISKKTISTDSRLRNIGKHGFGFVTEDHLTRGTVYKFNMMLSTSPLQVQARIIHFHIEATYYVCGARIENLSLLQRSRINHFLASKSAKLQRTFFFYSVVAGLAVAGATRIFGAAVPVAVILFFATAIGAYLLLPF